MYKRIYNTSRRFFHDWRAAPILIAAVCLVLMVCPANATGGDLLSAGGRPFVLLSAPLTLLGLALSLLMWIRDCGLVRKLIGMCCALTAAVLFIFTMGVDGFILADYWTIGVALLTAVPVVAFLQPDEKYTHTEK